MKRINLAPWRERLQLQRRLKIYRILLTVFILLILYLLFLIMVDYGQVQKLKQRRFSLSKITKMKPDAMIYKKQQQYLSEVKFLKKIDSRYQKNILSLQVMSSIVQCGVRIKRYQNSDFQIFNQKQSLVQQSCLQKVKQRYQDKAHINISDNSIKVRFKKNVDEA